MLQAHQRLPLADAAAAVIPDPLVPGPNTTTMQRFMQASVPADVVLFLLPSRHVLIRIEQVNSTLAPAAGLLERNHGVTQQILPAVGHPCIEGQVEVEAIQLHRFSKKMLPQALYLACRISQSIVQQ